MFLRITQKNLVKVSYQYLQVHKRKYMSAFLPNPVVLVPLRIESKEKLYIRNII